MSGWATSTSPQFNCIVVLLIRTQTMWSACFMKRLNFFSHLNLSPSRKAAREHTRSACQIKVWKWRRVSWGYCGIHTSMLLHLFIYLFSVRLFNKVQISPSFLFQKCLSLYTLTEQNRSKEFWGIKKLHFIQNRQCCSGSHPLGGTTIALSEWASHQIQCLQQLNAAVLSVATSNVWNTLPAAIKPA